MRIGLNAQLTRAWLSLEKELVSEQPIFVLSSGLIDVFSTSVRLRVIEMTTLRLELVHAEKASSFAVAGFEVFSQRQLQATIRGRAVQRREDEELQESDADDVPAPTTFQRRRRSSADDVPAPTTFQRRRTSDPSSQTCAPNCWR